MFIYKKPPRAHKRGEPLLYNNHKRPVTRRDFIAAGMLSGPAMVIGPAWLGALGGYGQSLSGSNREGLAFFWIQKEELTLWRRISFTTHAPH